MGITQKEIAKSLGVSLITIQRALNNSGYVSSDLKKRIFDFAKKNSYVPHRASQILVRNKIRLLSLFSSSFPEYFWREMNRGVTSAARYIESLSFEVRYHRIPVYDTKKYVKLLRKDIKDGCDAAAFINQPYFDMRRIVDIAEKSDLPYIFCNIDNVNTKRLCYIGSDYSSGGRLAANYIGGALGRKASGKILIVSTEKHHIEVPDDVDINSLKLTGFLDTIKKWYPSAACAIEYVEDKASPGTAHKIDAILDKYQRRVDAVYFIPAFNQVFLKDLEKYDYRGVITVLHDITDTALDFLKKGLLTAVVFQDPVLQGYTAVRTLERILEARKIAKLPDIEIAHTLIFRENISYLEHNHLFPGD